MTEHEPKVDKSLAEFVDVYESVMILLRVLCVHECGPPGIKGIMEELESVCEDQVHLNRGE